MVILLTSLLIGVFLIGASADSVQVIQANPGSSVTLNGHTTPGSNVQISCTGTISMGVSSGRYGQSLNGVYIPGGSSFSIRASPVTTLEISGSMYGISKTMDGAVSGDVGTFSMSGIPSGSYTITIFGKSSASSVSVTVTANQQTTADSNGDYSYSVNTGGLPNGVYAVMANGQHVADVYLGVSAPATPTPTVTASPTATVTPTPTNDTTPTPTVTASPTATVTPSPSPTANPGGVSGFIGSIVNFFKGTAASPTVTPTAIANGSGTTATATSSISFSVNPSGGPTPSTITTIVYVVVILLVLAVAAGVLFFWLRKR